jgi:hypothetical protein
MAKLKNPLFGFDARGSIAKLLTFRHRDQQTIAESKPIPKDAQTSEQLSWRTMYQKCVDLWHTLSDGEKLTWEAAARERHMTGYAWYMSQCLRPNPGIYLPLAGGTMQGDIAMASHKITSLPAPTANEEPARKLELTNAKTLQSSVASDVTRYSTSTTYVDIPTTTVTLTITQTSTLLVPFSVSLSHSVVNALIIVVSMADLAVYGFHTSVVARLDGWEATMGFVGYKANVAPAALSYVIKWKTSSGTMYCTYTRHTIHATPN